MPCTSGIPWPPLVRGTLIRRYKRFLADVRLDGGEQVTAHCPNSGSMKGCALPGCTVYLSRSDNPKRKLAFTWELIQTPTSLIGVNTLVPNRLVHHALANGQIPALSGYPRITREVRVDGRSRIDLMLNGGSRPACYIEVKNCTWVAHQTAAFPDAPTTRGARHMAALEKLAALGHRAVVFFLIQRMDAVRFRPADEIDPAYGKALRQAVNNGVELVVYDVHITLEHIRIARCLPWTL